MSKLRLWKKKKKKLTPEQLELLTNEVLYVTQKLWWEGGDSIEDIAKSVEEIMKDHYNPLGKVKLTKEQIRILKGDCEPVSIGFMKEFREDLAKRCGMTEKELFEDRIKTGASVHEEAYKKYLSRKSVDED